MADEYIPREDAIVETCHGCSFEFSNEPCEPCDCEIMVRLKSIPAADVVPVVHGRWVVSRTDYSWNGAEFPTHCKCDQCGREIPYLDRDAYCPTCGALMDKDGDGE